MAANISAEVPTTMDPKLDREPPIEIPDDFGYSVESLLIPSHYNGMVESVMIPHGLIIDRIERLARKIRTDYDGVTVHLLCVLKGGSAFFQDIVEALRAIHRLGNQSYIPFTFDFIRVKSYAGTQSTGNVQITGIDMSTLAGKHCLLVEDIIDSGKTMSVLVPHIQQTAGVASVKVASLLEKRTPKSVGFKADYCGFTIPDKFIVGYCMDYNEAFRDMGHICVISEDGIKEYAEEGGDEV
eukprot:CAMPEP_0119542830 /NCGR_PEP_ID=MMETSP1344-20130328/53804_1 /TAXON_ID=236787 /ORGANISM="Florenciella parvula, Strain CCMP2471" /LENGTH=239 /DNA_ID=CAMNT_0007587093 /DNA_START=58 /DNA_END=777 /DNA_ORIENTATION=+